jgi:ankyrin repeat protein
MASLNNRRAQFKAVTPRKAGGKLHPGHSRQAKALIEAIQCGQSQAAIRLLKGGVDPCARDSKGRSALWWACAWCRPSVIRELVKRGAELPDNALMGAVKAGDAKTVRFLIRHEANVNCVASGYSPVPQQNIKQVLLTAALARAAFQAKLESIPIMLIRAGAEVNRFILPRPMPGAENRTMLGMAAYSGSLKTVKAMLAAGVKVNQRDSSGRTALANALEQGHVSVAKVLRQAGAKM